MELSPSTQKSFTPPLVSQSLRQIVNNKNDESENSSSTQLAEVVVPTRHQQEIMAADKDELKIGIEVDNEVVGINQISLHTYDTAGVSNITADPKESGDFSSSNENENESFNSLKTNIKRMIQQGALDHKSLKDLLSGQGYSLRVKQQSTVAN